MMVWTDAQKSALFIFNSILGANIALFFLTTKKILDHLVEDTSLECLKRLKRLMCFFMLLNIRQDLIGDLLLGLAIGVEDEVVVTSVVARGASEARHVVLAPQRCAVWRRHVQHDSPSVPG